MCKIIRFAGLIIFSLLPIRSATQITGNIRDNYIGCYYNNVNDQSQLQIVTFPNRDILTIEWCVGQCLLRNSTYAGLEISFGTGIQSKDESSESCLCGNNVGVMVPDNFCDSYCPGKTSELCGGSDGLKHFHSLYAVCEFGYYGYLCDQVCQCRKQAPCDRMTGKCSNECEDKWLGTACNQTTLSDKYIGCFQDNQTRAISPYYFCDYRMTVEFCSNNCSLRNNSIVGLQAGCHCFCGEHYDMYGPRNEINCSTPCPGNTSQKCGADWTNSVYSVCPAGYYGSKCHYQCHCYNNRRCVYSTGECKSTCKAGWTGSSCNIRDCVTGGDCSQNETCVAVNLNRGSIATINRCNCLPGFRRNAFWEKCRVCEVGYYGPMCYQMCHCKEQAPCNRVTGECPNGCEEKWFGKTCIDSFSHLSLKYIGCFRDNQTRDISPKYYYSERMTLESCSRSCILQNTSIVGLQATAYCFCGETYGIYGPINESNCLDRCSGNSSQTCGGPWANSVYSLCPAGYYGPNCLNRCNCYDNSHCAYLTGECNSTCKAGWTGKSCNIRDCRINNGDCKYYETCESVNNIGFANRSMCLCKSGFYADNSTCRRAHLHYVGCYKGNSTQTVSVELTANETSTVESCIQKCKQLNYTYALIQGGEICLCGSDYGQILPDSDCQVSCAGNTLQHCGEPIIIDGTIIYAVYTVNNIFWCSSDEDCKPNQSCNLIDLKYTNISRCRCKIGFRSTTTPELCTDINECKSGASTCNTTSENCVNNIGSYECECKDGFSDLSGICEDIDECKYGRSTCNAKSEHCVNNIGSYGCECKVGFSNISGICADIDDCKSGASTCNTTSENCVNAIGSHGCECKDGFSNVSGICEDIDECESGALTCNQKSENCVNNIGSYGCECKVGFSNVSGICEAKLSCSSNTGVILGTIMTISLLINAFFVVSRIKNATEKHSKCPGPGIAMTWSVDEQCSTQLSSQREVNCGEISDPVCEKNVYEQILDRRSNTLAEYAEIKQDDYLKAKY